MAGKYTNNLQAAMLFEDGGVICPSVHLNPFRMAMLEQGLPLTVAQENESFALFLGPDELHISVTFHANPADHSVFANTLRSGLTNMLVDDAPGRVQRHRSHVLIEIWHGVLGVATDNAEIAGLFDKIGMARPGHSLDQFNRGCEVLIEVCRHLMAVQPASVIHWTQSNMLIGGEKAEALFAQERPGMLTVHPIMFGAEAVRGHDEIPVGMMSLGAADYIGREIYITPAPVPWVDLYESVLAFIRLAVMPNGYIIPDGETFGIETGEFSYRVSHLEGADTVSPDDAPCYQLSLLFHKQHGYTAPDFQRGDLVSGGIPEAAAILEAEGNGSSESVADWKDSERMATAAGGQFQIYRTESADAPSPRGPGPSGSRPVFGKRTGTIGRKH